MPLIRSAIIRMHQTRRRTMRRRPFKTIMKTMIRKVHDEVKSGNKDEAAKLLPAAYKAIDTAAKKFIIHPNNAARKKSSLAKLVRV